MFDPPLSKDAYGYIDDPRAWVEQKESKVVTRDNAIEAVKAAFNINAEARRIALADAIRACEGEKVVEPDNADDETYNDAIDHCIEAIKGVA